MKTKKIVYIFISVFLILFQVAFAASDAVYPDSFESHVGRSFDFTQNKKGGFESDKPLVADVDSRGHVSFLEEGQARITFTDNKSQEKTVIDFTVASGGSMPQEIKDGIGVALEEWAEYLRGGRSIPKSNKYTKWKCGRPCEFGWCGAFVNYSLDMGGVAMWSRENAEKLFDGRAAAIREAGVPKILEGFKKMDRIAYLPKPGYEVIYGRRGGYTTIHVGLVTDVKPLGEGKYEIQTVEGNMGPRIRRYHYIYDAFADDYERNMKALPLEFQIEPDVFQYTLHLDGAWYVTAFGQTWY